MQGSQGVPPGDIPVRDGDVLAGKYRVERILGVGGMGIVVAATHLQLHQKVALKFMLPDALKLPTLLERFAREARAAVRLKSDHVARVLDVGTLDSGSPYMVMEYLEGSDLGAMIESHGALPIDMAVDFVLQACDAVAEAHSIGIVHRDLKPRNLFVTQRNDGRALVKVLDFGIAKHTAAGSDLSLTKTTEVIGSPNYMSPEQLRAARAADERSDIWALGVILYELLTGALPFVAESVTQLILMVLSETPRPIRALRSDVPDDLVRVIERCLEKVPAARFASVAELAAALERHAPADARGLAARIARITSGGRLSAAQPATTTSPAYVQGQTTANWSARAGLTRSSRGKWVALAAMALAAVAAAIGVIGLRGPHDATPTSQAMGPAASAPASSMPTTGPAVTLIATTDMIPMVPAVPSSSVGSSPVADGGPGRLVRPRHEVVAPVDSTQNSEPKYRTSW